MVSVHPARRCTSPLGVVLVGSVDFPCVSFWENKFYSFFKSIVVGFYIPLGMLVAKWVPTPCYNDAYSVGTPKWAFWGKGWQNHSKTTFSPLFGRLFLIGQRTIFFFWGGSGVDALHWEGQASWAWPPVLFPQVSCLLKLSMWVVVDLW